MKIRKIICVVFLLCMLTSNAYGLINEIQPADTELKYNLEKEYGINIVFPENIEYMDWLYLIESSFGHFPNGVIKEITDNYLKNGIKTNIIFNKSENNSIERPIQYLMTDLEANIYINVMTNNYYGETNTYFLESFIHELSHFVSDYIFTTHGYDKINLEFVKLNEQYKYGSWNDDYNKVFVSRHSSISLYDDVSDIIWYAETHPDKIRNISSGNTEIIHKKIEYLAQIIDNSFESITEEYRLWQEAIPSSPDTWAENAIKDMKEKGMIPQSLDNNYDAYITKEDFYLLLVNALKNKLGAEEFYEFFNIPKSENYIKIDPIKGEIYIDDLNAFEDIAFCENKEAINEAFEIGLVAVSDNQFNPDAPITRLEVVKAITLLCNELGIDISQYNITNFSDISSVNELEKPYLYFAASKGLIRGDGLLLMPDKYSTYQESYVMLNRVLKLK